MRRYWYKAPSMHKRLSRTGGTGDLISIPYLQLREWDNYAGVNYSSTIFSMTATNELDMQESNVSSPLMFFNIAKSQIDGRKLKIDWAHTENNSNVYVILGVIDIALDRTNPAHFIENADYSLTSQPAVTNIQTLLTKGSPGRVVQFTPLMDMTTAVEDIVTVYIQLIQAWTPSGNNRVKLYSISLYEADETTLVTQFIPDSVSMEVTGTFADYGLCYP